MVKRDGKSLNDYNSNDVREAFLWLYSKKHHKEYPNNNFIGYDLKLIKQAIGTYGLFSVLSGFYNGIKRNSDTVSIKYILKGFEFGYYLPEHDAEMYYKIMVYGNDKIRAIWRKYLVLNSKWFPTASSEQKKKRLEQRLKEWTNAKES